MHGDTDCLFHPRPLEDCGDKKSSLQCFLTLSAQLHQWAAFGSTFSERGLIDCEASKSIAPAISAVAYPLLLNQINFPRFGMTVPRPQRVVGHAIGCVEGA
jgi:hypothetical protein